MLYQSNICIESWLNHIHTIALSTFALQTQKVFIQQLAIMANRFQNLQHNRLILLVGIHVCWWLYKYLFIQSMQCAFKIYVMNLAWTIHLLASLPLVWGTLFTNIIFRPIFSRFSPNSIITPNMCAFLTLRTQYGPKLIFGYKW